MPRIKNEAKTKNRIFVVSDRGKTAFEEIRQSSLINVNKQTGFTAELFGRFVNYSCFMSHHEADDSKIFSAGDLVYFQPSDSVEQRLEAPCNR